MDAWMHECVLDGWKEDTLIAWMCIASEIYRWRKFTHSVLCNISGKRSNQQLFLFFPGQPVILRQRARPKREVVIHRRISFVIRASSYSYSETKSKPVRSRIPRGPWM
jgi:hypothetical protein